MARLFQLVLPKRHVRELLKGIPMPPELLYHNLGIPPSILSCASSPSSAVDEELELLQDHPQQIEPRGRKISVGSDHVAQTG